MSTLLRALEEATEQALNSQKAAVDAVGMAEAMHEELEVARQMQGSTEDSTEGDSTESGSSEDGSLPPSKGWL